MAGTRYSEKTRQKALELVRLGKTYAYVQTNLAIPKSTLSVWVNKAGKKPDRTRQLAHLNVARIASAAVLRRNKESRIAQATLVATQLAGAVSINRKETGKALLAMLYWAEGGKQEGNMKLTNTDPDLIFFFLSLLRSCYPIDEERLHVALQLHYYHRAKEEVSFWSKKLNIPQSQFWKIYRKPRGGRGKYRTNFHGICNLHYSSSSIQRELLALNRELSKKLVH